MADQSGQSTSSDSGTHSMGSPPQGKRLKLDPESPLQKSSYQLCESVSTLATATINSMVKSINDRDASLSQLGRLYRIALSTIETLQESCDILKLAIENDVVVNSPHTSSGTNNTTTNETTTTDTKSLSKYTGPKFKFTKSVPSPTTKAVAEVNPSILAFLATARTETTNGIKADEPISEEKKKRLQYLLKVGERNLGRVQRNREDIECEVEQLKPGHKLPAYEHSIRIDGEALSELELKTIRAIREHEGFKNIVEEALELPDYRPKK